MDYEWFKANGWAWNSQDMRIAQRWVLSGRKLQDFTLKTLNHFRWRILFQSDRFPSVIAATADLFPEDPDPEPALRNGRVRLATRAFIDNDGMFLGFGATMFWALWGERQDPDRLVRNLAWLSDHSVNYIRILSMVGSGEYWKNRIINPNWSNYFEIFDRLFVHTTTKGLRINVVLFADTHAMMPKQSDRMKWVVHMADYLMRHRDQVQFVEIANESNHNGVDDGDLAELTRHWMKQNTGILVAPSSPDGDRSPAEAYARLFGEHNLSPDLLTPHFSRNIRTVEGSYRPHRQSYHGHSYGHVLNNAFVSDEPIGLGKKQGNETDPGRAAIGMATTYICGGAGYVMHSDAGIRVLHDFKDQPHIEPVMVALQNVLKILPANMPNGRLTRHEKPDHPYKAPNMIWPDEGANPNQGPHGVVRAYASEIDSVTYVSVMGLLGDYRVRAKWPMTVEVFDLCAQKYVATVNLNAGENHTFRVKPCRDFIHKITRR